MSKKRILTSMVAVMTLPLCSMALDLPFSNPKVQEKCVEPIQERNKARANYRTCIQRTGGREAVKAKLCSGEAKELAAARQELETCEIWATAKVAEEYKKKESNTAG